MGMTTGLIVIVALLIILVLLKRRQSSGNAHPNDQRKTVSHKNSQFHAVSIKFAVDPCHAARALEGRRFLSSAAPRLPLADCDAETCKCRFVHHKDRREEENRRDQFGSTFGSPSTTADKEKERRKFRERRDESSDDFF
jgi:hypothetical protein